MTIMMSVTMTMTTKVKLKLIFFEIHLLKGFKVNDIIINDYYPESKIIIDYNSLPKPRLDDLKEEIYKLL